MISVFMHLKDCHLEEGLYFKNMSLITRKTHFEATEKECSQYFERWTEKNRTNNHFHKNVLKLKVQLQRGI